jgi:tetratricopeptide (TPR) repeat protein
MIRRRNISRVKLYIALSFMAFCLFKVEAGVDRGEILSHFYRANAFYEKGNYDQAILEYESILIKGSESGALYYNLANSYFKEGDLGQALLNYEKAKKLIPRDNDLISNHDYARSLIKFSQSRGQNKGLGQFLNKVFEKFTTDELTAILAAIYFTAFIFILLHILGIMKRKTVILIILPLVTVLLLSLGGLVLEIKSKDQCGIITSAQTQANYEPHDKATLHFNLFEGMKIKVIKCKDSWCKIQRPDKKMGWIKEGTFKKF